MKFITLNFAVFLFLLSSFDVYAEEINLKKCKSVFKKTQKYKGKNYQVIVPKGKAILDLKEIFGKEDQVFLGVSKLGYYLYIGGAQGTRLHTQFLFLAPSYWIRDDKFSNGYLIHFPDIPKEKILAWKEKWAYSKKVKDSHTISCVTKSCSILKNEFGIKTNGSEINLFMGPTLNKILKKGFVDENGQPVPFQIFQVSPRVTELSSLIKKLAREDIFIAIFVPSFPITLQLIGENIISFFFF